MNRTTPNEFRGPEITPMLRDMLARQPGAETAPTAVQVRMVQGLERRAAATVSDARRTVGVDIDYLGIQPLFSDPRLYTADPNDWILGPAMRAEDRVVPVKEQKVLRRLAAADIDFPLIYTAHEVLKEKTKDIIDATSTPHTDLDAAHAAEVIGPVPDPHDTVTLGRRLEHRASKVLTNVRRTAVAGGTIAAGIVAAPVVLAGAALAAGLSQLDPIILGAMPIGEPREGQPAAWFVLARWDW